MPKEMTHWILADLLRKERTDFSGYINQAIEKKPEFYYLGSVVYDSPFYMTGRFRQWQEISASLHGYNSEDTFAVYRLMADKLLLNPGSPDFKESAIAFIAGALIHMAADCTFHPVVFYYTGDSGTIPAEDRSGWLYRHRAFETALDCYLSRRYDVPFSGRLKILVRAMGKSFSDCPAILSVFFSCYRLKISYEEAGIILKTHIRSQQFFFNKCIGFISPLFFLKRRKTDSDLTCLIYPAREKPFSFFDGIPDYKNPVTGKPEKADMQSLIRNFLTLAKSLISELEISLTNNKIPFQEKMGMVLDTGIPANQEQKKMYFLEPMDILNRLKR